MDIRVSAYSTATWVIRQHEPQVGIHIIRDGCVAISAERADHRETVLYLEGRGVIMNLEDWVLARPTYSLSARTLTESTIIFIGKDDLRRLFTEDPAISRLMTAHLARRMEVIRRRHIAHLTTNVKSRLVSAFRELLEATGQHQSREAHFESPITRQLLADIVGAAPESISRAMTEIETETLIIRNPSRISIPDVPRFIHYSNKAAYETAPDRPSRNQDRTTPYELLEQQ
ncbi:Crp/Fnr family transcriptional regulator [Nitrospira sp. NS4]|uniref:Crp/Fnr family transcriptional regulator n=1 Tax=Nitrospira sp. NS4 TaxID=3414498 RepID=UPI003C2AE69C